ncbi:MAG: sulfate ABC transporter permease subunit [Anaerolineae bacterium]
MKATKPRSLWAGLLIGGVLLYAAVLLFAPMISIVQGAFSRGAEAAINSLNDPELIHAFGVTILLAVVSTTVNTVVGIAIAWVLVRHQFPGKAVLNALVDLPAVASPVIIGFVVIVIFGRGGWLAGFPFQIAFAIPGMLLVTLFVTLPYVVREVMPVLASLTTEQEEAAATLGAGRFYTFRRVIFPGIWHGVLYGAVLTLSRAVGDFGGVLAAGGGIQGATETATIYISRALHDRNRIGAYTVALLLGVFAIAVLVVINRLRAVPTETVVSASEPENPEWET